MKFYFTFLAFLSYRIQQYNCYIYANVFNFMTDRIHHNFQKRKKVKKKKKKKTIKKPLKIQVAGQIYHKTTTHYHDSIDF